MKLIEELVISAGAQHHVLHPLLCRIIMGVSFTGATVSCWFCRFTQVLSIVMMAAITKVAIPEIHEWS